MELWNEQKKLKILNSEMGLLPNVLQFPLMKPQKDHECIDDTNSKITKHKHS